MNEPTFASRASLEDRDKRVIRPVSADETLREYGRAGRREALTTSIWSLVRPKQATAGIVVGGKIRVWGGHILTVTRVGTIAGFGMLNGREVRWDINSVREIIIENVEVAA